MNITFCDDAGHVPLIGRYEGLTRFKAVVFRGQGMPGEIPRNLGRVGDPKGRCAGGRLHQERVGVAVVASGELHYLVSPGKIPGQTDGAHVRLGAGAHHSDHFHGRDCLHNHSGKDDLEFGRSAETAAAVYRLSLIHPLQNSGAIRAE